MAEPSRGLTVAAGSRSALVAYRFMAYVVGCMLIVVFVSIPFPSVEQVVGPIHGGLYIVYLLAVLNLVARTRLGLWALLAMVTGGWVPFAAFAVERWTTHRLEPGDGGRYTGEAASRSRPAAGPTSRPAGWKGEGTTSKDIRL